MDLDSLDKMYVCSSATWSILESAQTPEEAAAKALQSHMESGPSFSIEAKIKVIEVSIVGEPIDVDAPSVFADLGFHKISKDLSKAIKKDK